MNDKENKMCLTTVSKRIVPIKYGYKQFGCIPGFGIQSEFYKSDSFKIETGKWLSAKEYRNNRKNNIVFSSQYKKYKNGWHVYHDGPNYNLDSYLHTFLVEVKKQLSSGIEYNYKVSTCEYIKILTDITATNICINYICIKTNLLKTYGLKRCK